MKVPWTLTSSLTRKVGGTNKELPDDGNSEPDIRVYGVIDNNLLGYLDYRLWKIDDPEGAIRKSLTVCDKTAKRKEKKKRLKRKTGSCGGK